MFASGKHVHVAATRNAARPSLSGSKKSQRPAASGQRSARHRLRHLYALSDLEPFQCLG